jgi:hypothetical protein
VIVRVAVDMLHRARRRFVDMHNAHGVVRIGKTRCGERSIGKREGHSRHQHAKHVGERKDASRQQSSRLGQTRQHPPPMIRQNRIQVNLGLFQPVAKH